MIAKSVVKVPMTKLLAVASLAGAGAGTALVVSVSATDVVTDVATEVIEVPPAEVSLDRAAVEALLEDLRRGPPRFTIGPAIPDEHRVRPYILGNGWPACANVASKAMVRRDPCPTVTEQTVGVALGSAFPARR